MRLVVMFVALFVLVFLIFAFYPASASELGDTAAGMAPGTWAELHPADIVPSLTGTGGASGIIFGYAETLRWDPTTRRLFYIGEDHGQPEGERFVAYREDENRFEVLPVEPWMAWSGTPSHGNDHHALDPVRGAYYFRYPYMDRSVYRYQIDSGAWTRLPDNGVLEYAQCCGGLDWFPEMDAVIWVQGSEFLRDETIGIGGVFQMPGGGGEWTRLGVANGYEMGMYGNFAEYNPVHHVVLFGGGNSPGSRKLYQLDAGGTITPLAEAPVDLGVHQAVHTVDPVSGEYLVFTNAREFYAYDVGSDTWRLQPGDAPIWTPAYGEYQIHGVVAGPIASYGVTAFVSCNIEDCRMHLYRHSPGVGTTPPERDAGVGGGADAAAGATGGESGGCACRAAGARAVSWPAAALLFVLLRTTARRRRRPA